MLNVTAQAVEHLVGERDERGLGRGAGVRLLPMAKGVGMTFLREPKRGDAVVRARDLRIFIAPDVAPKVEGLTLDVARQEGNLEVVLRPPNTRTF